MPTGRTSGAYPFTALGATCQLRLEHTIAFWEVPVVQGAWEVHPSHRTRHQALTMQIRDYAPKCWVSFSYASRSKTQAEHPFWEGLGTTHQSQEVCTQLGF